MYHRPIGCSESDYSSCLQLIREDDITCAQSSMVKVAIDNNDIDDNENVNGDYDGIAQMPNGLTKVAPLSSANEDVYGRPRHAEEAVRVAAVLREVLHDVFLAKIASRICQAKVQKIFNPLSEHYEFSGGSLP